MRATRAYIAGFGTAGSLLAGASMVFVLASAVVAFRGWPQVGAAPTPASVVMARPHLSTPSAAHARLLAAALHPSAAARARSGQRGSSAPSTTRLNEPPAKLTISSAAAARLAAPPVAVGLPPSKPPAATPSCGLTCRATGVTGTVGTVVQSTTGTVGSTVTAAGQSLGSTVTGLTNAVASKLAPVSKPLANVVNNAGSAVSGVLNNTANAAGQLVNGVGNTLSRALRH